MVAAVATMIGGGVVLMSAAAQGSTLVATLEGLHAASVLGWGPAVGAVVFGLGGLAIYDACFHGDSRHSLRAHAMGSNFKE